MKATKTKKINVAAQTGKDFKNSVLIVSVLVNLFIFTTWLVIEASPAYALSLVTLN